MALDSRGWLILIPQSAIDILSATPIAHLRVPQIAHGFRRLCNADWSYVELATRMAELNPDTPPTRREVDAVWYDFVSEEFNEWQHFEFSRLAYRIPAASGKAMLNCWLDGWRALVGYMRSMSNYEADEHWEKRWFQVRRNNSRREFDITPADLHVPPQLKKYIEERERRNSNRFYMRMRQWCFGEDYNKASAVNKRHAETFMILHEWYFDAHNLGMDDIPTDAKLQTRAQKAQRRSDIRRERRERKRATAAFKRGDALVGVTIKRFTNGHGQPVFGEKRTKVVFADDDGVLEECEESKEVTRGNVEETGRMSADRGLNVDWPREIPHRPKRKFEDVEGEDKENDGVTESSWATDFALRFKRRRDESV